MALIQWKSVIEICLFFTCFVPCCFPCHFILLTFCMWIKCTFHYVQHLLFSTLSPLFTLIFPLLHCNNMVLSFTGEQLIASRPLICRDYWHCWRVRNGNKLGVKAKVWEERLNSTFVWGHGEYKVASKQNKWDLLHQTGFNGDVSDEV